MNLKLGRTVPMEESGLDSIPRARYREEKPGFSLGWDIWNAFEISHLDLSGCPVQKRLKLMIPADSPRILESKSLKLYLNALNNRRMDPGTFAKELQSELSAAVGAAVTLEFAEPQEPWTHPAPWYWGECLDTLSVPVMAHPDPSLLQKGTHSGHQVWTTHLFRSCCPVTGQPDWASIRIEMHAQEVSPEHLLRYLVAYRNHQAFHEACCEQICRDLSASYKPDTLQVICYFSRRGGIDIQPVRWLPEPLQPHQPFFH